MVHPAEDQIGDDEQHGHHPHHDAQHPGHSQQSVPVPLDGTEKQPKHEPQTEKHPAEDLRDRQDDGRVPKHVHFIEPAVFPVLAQTDLLSLIVFLLHITDG